MILGLLLASITGAALHGDTLYTWGDRLLAWTLPKLKSHLLAVPLRQVYAVLWRMGLIEVKA